MFDKTFFKFALGLAAIILLSIGALYATGYIENGTTPEQASVR